MPNAVIFTVAGSDYKLRVYSSDLRENNTCKLLSGHTSYINDISYDSDNSYLVSASDDNTVKIWTTDDYKLKNTFHLTSPGNYYTSFEVLQKNLILRLLDGFSVFNSI